MSTKGSMRNPTSGGGGPTPDVHGFPHMDTARDGTRYYFGGTYGSYSTRATFTYTADRINAVPIVFARSTTLVGLHVHVNNVDAGGGKAIRLGVYDAINDASNLFPNALILDAGTVPTNALARQDIVINLTLTGGKLYWLSSLSNSSIVSVWAPQRYTMWPILGWDATLGGVAGGNRGGRGWVATQAYGALPATFPTAGAAIYGDAVDAPGIVYSMA